MNQNNDAAKTVEISGSDSPFNKEFFLIQGQTFRCMAYKDGNGKWRGAFNDVELPGAIRILA